MKIARLCYNNFKRKKAQLLLVLCFLLVFTICVYLNIQQTMKTVIYKDDVNAIHEGLTKPLFLKPSQAADFSFEQSDLKITDHKLENFPDDIKNLRTTKASDVMKVKLKGINNTLEYVNSKFGNELGLPAEEPLFVSSQEKNHSSQHENIIFSLQGFLNLHVWEKVCHFQVESLRQFILFPQVPSKRRLLTSSSLFSEKDSNLGERMFGFVSPSTSGQYQFAISSSGNSELWLSSDETSANLRKIAHLGSRDNPGRGKPRNYFTDSSQVSKTLSLTNQLKYYIDVLHKHKSGKVHLEVAWRFEGEEEFRIIRSGHLWGKMNDSQVPDNAVQLDDFDEQPQQSRDSVLPYFDPDGVREILPECPYEPSYLVKHKLIRFQGARNKSNTHFAAVYPPDTSNNSVALMYNEDIWWQENAAGNEMTNPNLAEGVARMFMDALEAKYPQLYALQEIISVEHVPDPLKGDRFLLELRLINKQTRGSALLSEHVYRSLAEDSALCYPEGFQWNKTATVNIIVPVKNSGRWALYFIKNIAEVISQTQDFNVHVIIVDYESKDIDIEAVLQRSTIKWYSLVRIPGEQGFQRALALQRGAAVVTDPHSILFMCDLNLKIPANLISTIRKHCVEGKMAFAPVVKRLRCGYYPGLPFGYWETLGFGLMAIYKSDFDRVGGMNVREFTGWGGEDWELVDRILMSGLEVERLKIPDFYHFYHPAFAGSNKRIGA